METFSKTFEYKQEFKKELFFLKKLSKYNNFPKIIKISKMEIEMSFCGSNFIEPDNIEDWKQQIKKILSILQKEKIYHNDMHQNNFLCKGKKIFLIDFALSSLNKEKKPYNNIDCKDIEKYEKFSELIKATNCKSKIKEKRELGNRKSKTFKKRAN